MSKEKLGTDQKLQLQLTREEAVRDQGGLCYWCRRSIIDLQNIDEKQIVQITQHFVIYLDDTGRRHMAFIATADHVVPRAEGGKHRRQNIVAACAVCNTRRGKATAQQVKKENNARRL